MSDSNPVQESDEVAVQNRYKGARCRKRGGWVSEICVPGTKEVPAAAHDAAATYCLRGPSTIESLNVPLLLPATVQQDKSPRSVKSAASDAGTAMDAQMVVILNMGNPPAQVVDANENNAGQGIQQQELGNERDRISISADDHISLLIDSPCVINWVLSALCALEQ